MGRGKKGIYSLCCNPAQSFLGRYFFTRCRLEKPYIFQSF
jgi:hypothetical protein